MIPPAPLSSQDTILANRGVFREEICPADEQWFKIVTSKGKIGTVHFPNELCDAGLEERLWARLDEKDPERHLKAI